MEINIKKFSVLILLLSVSLLTACGDDNTESAKAQTEAVTTKVASTTVTETSVSEEKTEPAEVTGESLVKANCVRCHGDEVYTRADHKVTSLEGLAKQVRMCDTQLEVRLFPEDLDKIVTYLNETYYKF